jgi:hypothetical protein
MEELEKFAQEECVKFELEKSLVIQNLVKSFPRLLEAVIEAQSWYTVYCILIIFIICYVSLHEPRSRRKNEF